MKHQVFNREAFKLLVEERFLFNIYNPKVRKNNLNKSFSFGETNKQKQRFEILEKVRISVTSDLKPLRKLKPKQKQLKPKKTKPPEVNFLGKRKKNYFNKRKRKQMKKPIKMKAETSKYNRTRSKSKDDYL